MTTGPLDPKALDTSKATYEPRSGNSVALYNDACDDKGGGAFADLSAAIRDAQHFIFIADWSFQPMTRLTPRDTRNDDPIGLVLARKAVATPKLHIAIHTWDHTSVRNYGAPDPQNDFGGYFVRGFLDLAAKEAKRPGYRPKNLEWRHSSRTGEDGQSDIGWSQPQKKIGWSHHQKFVVLDTAAGAPLTDKRLLTVFFGGLDLTKGRVDCPAHPNLPNDSHPLIDLLRRSFHFAGNNHSYDDWYNAEFQGVDWTSLYQSGDLSVPRQTWHDIHARLTGPAAWDFVREFVGRWCPDPAVSGPPARSIEDSTRPSPELVMAKYLELRDMGYVALPGESIYEANARPGSAVNAQVLRSMTSDHWNVEDLGYPAQYEAAKDPSYNVEKQRKDLRDMSGKMKQDFVFLPGKPSRGSSVAVESSIQEAYVSYIDRAERFIYIETQYFIGSGKDWSWTWREDQVKNPIPERLVQKIKDKRKQRQPFHVYIVIPLFPEGNPLDLVPLIQRTYQWNTIEYMVNALGSDWNQNLSFYFLAQWADDAGSAQPQGAQRADMVKAAKRYMIYVHSKLMIVDDTAMILGSANLNERSLAGGRDSEICVGMWGELSGYRQVDAIRDLRQALWREHLGISPQMADDPLDVLRKYWMSPEDPNCVYRVLALARKNYFNFRRGNGRQASGHLCAWPVVLGFNRVYLAPRFYLPDFAPGLPPAGQRPLPDDWESEMIPDHPIPDAVAKAAYASYTTYRVATFLGSDSIAEWSLRNAGSTPVPVLQKLAQ